jgi:hypothetical protein
VRSLEAAAGASAVDAARLRADARNLAEQIRLIHASNTWKIGRLVAGLGRPVLRPFRRGGGGRG